MSYKLNGILTLIYFIFINTSVFSQLNNKSAFIDSTIKTDSLNVPIHHKIFYFPFSIITDSAGRLRGDSLEEHWFSGMLFALHEPLLYNRIDEKEVYRFTWLRTFHHPIVIRIEKYQGKIYLYIKESEGAGGYYPGKVISNQTKELSDSQWNIFMSMLNNIDFWHMATHKYVNGRDGAEWILEGTTKDSYKVVVRWSPEESDSFRSCCLYLLNLSGTKIRKKYIY